MKAEVQKRLLASQNSAAAQVAAVEKAVVAKNLSPEKLQEALFSYILAKYLLERAEVPDRSIQHLAQASLAKAARIDPSLLQETDRSATCDGASSVDMKQALLIVAIQREFQVRIDGIKAAYAETTDDIASLIYQQLADRQ